MLFNYWSRENKITESPTQTTWTMEFIHTYYGTPVYEYHQITTKIYSYVGMDYKTALKCRDAMYLRYRKVYTVFNNQYLAFAPQRDLFPIAEVSMSNDGGHMWRVDISINEDQKQYWMKIDDPRDLGLWERPVDFEDDEPIGDYFMVTDTEMLGASLLMRYAYDFEGFNASNIYAVKSDDGKTWVDIPYTIRPDGRLQILAPNMAPLIRLEYRSAATMLKSNIIDTGKDPAPVPVGTLQITSAELWNVSEPVWQILYTQDIEDFHTYNLKIYSRELSQSEDDWTDITNHCTSVNGRVITDLTRVDPPYAFKIAYGEISSEFIPYSPDYDFGDGSIVVEGRVSEAAVYGASATISLYTTKNDVIPSKSRLTLLESDDGANWSPVEVVTSTKLEDRTGSGAYYWVYTEPILKRYARLMYEGVHATTFRTMAQYKWREIPAGQLEVEPLGVKREYLQPANITHYQIPFHIVQNSEGGGWKEITPENVGASIRMIWPEKESEFRRINDATYDVNTGRLDIGIPIEFTVGAYCEILMTIYQGDGGWVIPLPLSREHELIPNA